MENQRIARERCAPCGRGVRPGLAMSVLVVSVWALCCRSASADAPLQVYGDLEMATDSMFRGVSQSMSSASLAADLTVEHDSGWYLNMWTSNVDFVDAGDPQDGANWEFDVMLGRSSALSDRIALDLSWVQYLYPGTRPGVDYDYNEWLASVSLDEAHVLTVGWSPDVFGSAQPGTYYALSTAVALPGDHWLGVLAAHYDLDRAYGQTYQHAEVSISGQLASMDWRATYHLASSDAQALFLPSTVASRLVLSLGAEFDW